MARLPQVRPSALTANPTQASAAAIEGQAASSAFGVLAQSASQFRQTLQPALNQQAEDQAAEDVADAFENREDGRLPDIQRRLPFSEQAAAYNNAVASAFVARAEMDMENEITRLRLEKVSDPEAFEAAANSYVESYFGGEDGEGPDLPMSLLSRVEAGMQERIIRTQARLSEQAMSRAIDESRDALERRLANINAEISTAIYDPERGIEWLESEEGQERLAAARDVVTLLTDNPLFGWSDERGADELDAIANAGRESVLYRQVSDLYDREGEVPTLEYINEAVGALNVSNSERIGVRSRLYGVVQERAALDNARREEIRLAQEAADRRARIAADAWEASVFERRVRGEPLTPDDIREGRLHIQSGRISATTAENYFAADPATTVENDASIATLFDAARYGQMTEEELREAMRPMLGSELNYTTYNSILEVRGQFEDDRYQRAFDTVGAFTSQSEYGFTYNANLDIMENQIREEVLTYGRLNPEAGPSDIRNYALDLVFQQGRRIPPPAVSFIQGAPSVPMQIQSADQVREYVEAAMLSVQRSDLDTADQDRLLQQIEQWEVWGEYQLNLLGSQQGGSSAGD